MPAVKFEGGSGDIVRVITEVLNFSLVSASYTVRLMYQFPTPRLLEEKFFPSKVTIFPVVDSMAFQEKVTPELIQLTASRVNGVSLEIRLCFIGVQLSPTIWILLHILFTVDGGVH